MQELAGINLEGLTGNNPRGLASVDVVLRASIIGIDLNAEGLVDIKLGGLYGSRY
jgi:hypothetical protein